MKKNQSGNTTFFQLRKYLQVKGYLRKIKKFTKNPFILSVIILALVLYNIAIALFIIRYISEIPFYQLASVTNFPVIAPSYPYIDSIPKFDLSASSYIILERDSRVIVDSFNDNLYFPPASTAKIMTAMVTLEHYSLNTFLEAKDISIISGSKMGLYEGEIISVENLLYGLLLSSGNDAAYVLASHYPGGVAGFVNRMNRLASAIKINNTTFTDPSGFDDSNTTTAFDLAHLATFALSNPEFSKIVATKDKSVLGINSSTPHELVNLNKLLGKEGVNGVKTGYTEEAGEVLVTSFDNNNKSYIVVVLKSRDRFTDSEKLIEQIVRKVKLLPYDSPT